jgi:hypothetical protein
MSAALVICRERGGLWRWHGGYWVPEQPPANHRLTTPPNGVLWFGTRTVRALLQRKKVENVPVPGLAYMVRVKAVATSDAAAEPPA